MGGAPCVSKWRMRRKDDNSLTPLIFAWLGFTAASCVVMAAAILNKPWGMHLFCIKPFQSDNSPWAADGYKFSELRTGTFRTRQPPRYFIHGTFQQRNKVYGIVCVCICIYDEDIQRSHFHNVHYLKKSHSEKEDLPTVVLSRLFFLQGG